MVPLFQDLELQGVEEANNEVIGDDRDGLSSTLSYFVIK